MENHQLSNLRQIFRVPPATERVRSWHVSPAVDMAAYHFSWLWILVPLLLAGPALSLPNMLVIRSIMGTQKTLVFVSLVIVMATLSGLIYGAMF